MRSVLLQIPGWKDRWRGLVARRLVDAFDAVHARDFADVGEYAFELTAVGNFKTGFDTGVQAVGAAFQIANIRASTADDRCNVREQAGTIFGTDCELYREGCGAIAAPLNGNAALGLVHKILHVGAGACVHSHATTTRDVTHNFIAGNRIAALGAKNQQIVVPLDDQGRFAKTQHALYGSDQGGLGVVNVGSRGLSRLTQNFCKNLPGRIFSKAHRSVQIFNLGKAPLRGGCLPITFRYFFQAAAESARFFFQQPVAHFSGFFAFVKIDPVADFAFGVGGLYETEPIAAGTVAFLRKNFDHVAAGNFVAERDHVAVHFCANALMAHLGVNSVSKIDRRSAGRKFQNAAFGREGVNFVGREIDFKRGEEFAGFLQFLGPLNQLAHPDDALIIVTGGLAVLVFPVSRNSFFRDAMHFLGAYLHFEWLASMDDGGMERLIKIGPRHGDVILEAARHWAPDMMDDAEGRVTTTFGIGDDADGEQIVNLF